MEHDIHGRLLGREEGDRQWTSFLRILFLWRFLEAGGPPRTGTFTMGLSHGVSIPLSTTINLQGILEVPWGIMCYTGLVPVKTSGEFSQRLDIYKNTTKIRKVVGGSKEAVILS